jgi:hypothetical protein
MRSNKRLIGAFVVAGATVTGSLALVSATKTSRAETTQAGQAGQAGAPIQPAPICIMGVSKNLCDGQLIGGDWQPTQCTQGGSVICNTLVGRKATLTAMVQSNAEQCSAAGACDETPELAGFLRAVVNIHLRRDMPCQTRGCWNGQFNVLNAAGGIVAKGTLRGTLGVGTHRLAICPDQECGTQCESCYAASFDPATKTWRIHAEAALEGRITAGPNAGAHICTTLQGYFVALGDDTGPQPPMTGTPGWKFCGTTDGVIERRCLSTEPPLADAALSLDTDYDGDIDLIDFATFQACFNGPNRPPACEE